MNINIRGAKRNEYHTVTLIGNRMTGDTYPVKGFIKDNLGGKWDGTTKSWVVDTNEVEYWLGKGAILQVSDSQPQASAHGNSSNNGWCNKCHSYCWGDCSAH